MAKKSPSQRPASKSDDNWASPQSILNTIGKRQLSIASDEENRMHRELRNTPGTQENADHTRLITKPRKPFFGNIALILLALMPLLGGCVPMLIGTAAGVAAYEVNCYRWVETRYGWQKVWVCGKRR
jgi:hypothetical protein